MKRSYVEDALAALATDNSDRSAEQPPPSAETLQVPDELNQATDTLTEEQGDPTEQHGEDPSPSPPRPVSSHCA